MSAPSAVVARQLRWLAESARSPRLRTMREFAEQEIVIPNGYFAGTRFSCSIQPFTGLFFDAVDSGRWSNFTVTGPSQSGKTLMGFCIPILYHLFEWKETVVVGLPDLDMAEDKWKEDLMPLIESSRYRELLPRRGTGSKGGKTLRRDFSNGATLRYMSGGGSDKSRAGFTSRVVVITETDGMDEAGEGSRESDKVSQLEARVRSWSTRARIYKECTVSIKEGRTWSDYSQGTASRIVAPCPACGEYVSPEREHLHGWQDAADVIQARALAAFVCPECGVILSNDDRVRMMQSSRLLHKGERINSSGQVSGEAVATDSLGFRWSGFHNLLLTPGDLGVDEYRGARASDEEMAERKLCQFVWALPYAPDKEDETALDAWVVMKRQLPFARGVVPAGAEFVTAGLDLGKTKCHYVVLAWFPGARCHVVDYGVLEVLHETLGVERGLADVMMRFDEIAGAGWIDEGAKPVQPTWVFVDSGWETETVYSFCRREDLELRGRWMPVKGFGALQRAGHYVSPRKKNSDVRSIGNGWHIVRVKAKRIRTVMLNSDEWKAWVHKRLATPVGEPGALTFYETANPFGHERISKHLLAEKVTKAYDPKRGWYTKLESVRKDNHYLDATYIACAAGNVAGARLESELSDATSSTAVAQVVRVKAGASTAGSGWFASQVRR